MQSHAVLRSIGVLLVAAFAFGQSRALPPQDESGRDPVFAAFLTQLRETVRRQDTAALLRVISPGIQNSFGDDNGAVEFRRKWELDKSGSKVWGVMDRLLRLGGVWSGPNTYCAPYIAVMFPDDLDRSEHYVVAGTGVRLRAAASTDATVLERLSYHIVRMLEWSEDWTRVRTLDGATGFIATPYLYGPLDYRACFSRSQAGVWQMSVLVAGD